MEELNEWLVMTIASNDLFDFDKLFEMMDEDIVSPMIGAAEAEARSQGAHGLRPEQFDEAAASQEHAENEAMEVAKEVVVNEMTLSAYSAMKDLRAAANGSKQKILDRLNYVIKREERRQATLLALEHMKKDDQPIEGQQVPKLPSLRDDFTT